MAAVLGFLPSFSCTHVYVHACSSGLGVYMCIWKPCVTFILRHHPPWVLFVCLFETGPEVGLELAD